MSVVVVGAGLAGLTAAIRLVGYGLETTVLEARDRVGGRTHGIRVAPGTWADAGAAYFEGRHTALTALLDDAGLHAVPAAPAGDGRFALDATGETRGGPFPPLRATALGTMFDLLDDLGRRVRADAPWCGAGAAALDRVTASRWADEHLRHPDARLFFPLLVGQLTGAHPADVSALHLGFALRSGGGPLYLGGLEGGARGSHVAGGAHRLCERLAASLGDRVRLRAPVRALHQDRNGVTVHSAAGSLRCDSVVVAVPPALADAIDHRPRLAAPRAGVRVGPGRVVKVHLVYPRPVWRDQGLCGWSVSATGPLLSTMDESGSTGGVGTLAGLVTGRRARRFRLLDGRRQREAVVAQVSRLFPGLPAPVGVHVTDWVGDPWSRGSYAAPFRPGHWLRAGPHLKAPHGRVHWAGSETSTGFFGLMEGAIRSGHRAAAEVCVAGR